METPNTRPERMSIWKYMTETERQLFSWLYARREEQWDKINDLHRMARENQFTNMDELRPQIEEMTARWFEGSQIMNQLIKICTDRAIAGMNNGGVEL